MFCSVRASCFFHFIPEKSIHFRAVGSLERQDTFLSDNRRAFHHVLSVCRNMFLALLKPRQTMATQHIARTYISQHFCHNTSLTQRISRTTNAGCKLIQSQHLNARSLAYLLPDNETSVFLSHHMTNPADISYHKRRLQS